MLEPTYDILEVPHPLTNTHITHYSAIRLLGLQTDPQAFGSTYERESSFTKEQWQERLNTRGAITLFARIVYQPSGGSSGDENWVGTAKILTPDMLRAIQYSLPQGIVEEGTAVYILVGVWIHTTHRRRGLARRLVEAGLDTIRLYDRDSQKALVLEVNKENKAAKALYENLGFVGVDLGEDPGKVWMRRVVKDEK